MVYYAYLGVLNHRTNVDLCYTLSDYAYYIKKIKKHDINIDIFEIQIIVLFP